MSMCWCRRCRKTWRDDKCVCFEPAPNVTIAQSYEAAFLCNQPATHYCRTIWCSLAREMVHVRQVTDAEARPCVRGARLRSREQLRHQ